MLAPLVLVLVASLAVLPNSRPSPLPETNPLSLAISPGGESNPLVEAERARQNGDDDAAVRVYRSLIQQADRATAEEARTRIAGIELARGRLEEAAAEIEPLTGSSTPRVRERATLLLAEVARTRKDCASAVPRYQTLVANRALLTPYARLGLYQCAESAGDAISALQHVRAILEQGPHRRLRIEALERLAAMEQQRGNTDRFLEIYDELYELGATRTYRGTVLFKAAETAREAGRQDVAVKKLSLLIRAFPEHPRALTALDLLNTLQESSAITWTQAALVRLQARQEVAARSGFETALAESPNGPEAAVARYQLATLILKQGRESEAVREMRLAAEQQPSSWIAPTALYRAGRIIESNGGLDEARQIYGQLAADYPDVTYGKSGRFRLGLLQYVRGDRSGALSSWEPLANDDTSREIQTLALQWQGKTYWELGNRTDGDERLQRAQQLGPDTFGGIRAGAIERGEGPPIHAFQSLQTSPARTVDVSPELDAWLASMGTSQTELQDSLSSEPIYQRAVDLTLLGMREQASWELDGLAERAADQENPPAHQFFLATAEMALGYPARAMATSESSVQTNKLVRTRLPVTFQRMLMPLAFGDALLASANKHHTDPLLLAAIVRQESKFEPSARSPVGAVGLSQIMPASARTIASALGYRNISEAELLKPAVNLEFGAYHLARDLDEYNGSILPALAAYNAGGGVVNGWLSEYGRADMDLFAARIPYNETSTYVQVVYENYGIYRQLYRGA
jgi:soluble lytic murein transglycosylase